MVVQSDFAEIANINSGKSVRKKRTETFIDIKQIEVVEKSFIPDRQMLYLRTKKTHSTELTKAIAATYLRPIYLLGLRASEALDYEVLFADTAKFSAGQIQSAYKNIEQGDIQNVFRPLMEGKKYEPCWTYVSNGHHYDLEKNPLIVKIYTRK